MNRRFSLHKARTAKCCDVCGFDIPKRPAGEEAEYWQMKGGEPGEPRTICCLCHALFDLPTDGWVQPADGRFIGISQVSIADK